MRYWVTTHWPKRKGEEIDLNVWLPEDRKTAGDELTVGDKVIVYESKSGPTRVTHQNGRMVYSPCEKGQEGVIAYGEICNVLRSARRLETEHYTNREPITWRLVAEISPLSSNGFLARTELLLSLRYKPTWNLHGFGTKHSGLKEISQKQFEEIARKYKRKA